MRNRLQFEAEGETRNRKPLLRQIAKEIEHGKRDTGQEIPDGIREGKKHKSGKKILRVLDTHWNDRLTL